jgi:Mrp family chromosome partitioning ATPase
MHADGALIVTTPQDVAIIDVRKEISFCRKTSLPILGVVENMSGLCTPLSNVQFMDADGKDVSQAVLESLPPGLQNCLACCEVFAPSKSGAEGMAKSMNVPFLGRVPLDPEISRAAESGTSIQQIKSSKAVASFNAIVDGALSSPTVVKSFLREHLMSDLP